MIHDTILDVDQYILLDVYNAKIETEKLEILDELLSLLKNLDISQNKCIIFGDDFNMFFNSKLDGKSDKPHLTRKTIAEFVEIK